MGDISLVSRGKMSYILVGLEYVALPLQDMDGLDMGRPY